MSRTSDRTRVYPSLPLPQERTRDQGVLPSPEQAHIPEIRGYPSPQPPILWTNKLKTLPSLVLRMREVKIALCGLRWFKLNVSLCPIAHVPHTPCTPYPLRALLAMCPIPPVPTPLVPLCPCGSHCLCTLYPCTPLPPVSPLPIDPLPM